MKFKYLMRGIGLGVIITAVVMGAYSRSAVADARVSVLKEYGLDEDKPILPEAQTTEDIEPTSEPVIVGGEETEPAEEVGTDATQDSDQPEDITTPDIQGNAEDENEEESSTANVVTVEMLWRLKYPLEMIPELYPESFSMRDLLKMQQSMMPI